MITFFGDPSTLVYAVQSRETLESKTIDKLIWLFGNRPQLPTASIDAFFVGPRAEMITPWSTNAVEITTNMMVEGIQRIEQFVAIKESSTEYDPMLERKYNGIGQDVFTINVIPQPIQAIEDIEAYNQQEGLSLSTEEIDYLQRLSQKLGRPLTDSEVFGFSQVNSEHCRHKIFNGIFTIDGEEKPDSLFALIKKTSHANPNAIVSAYKDNVAFVKGPEATQFAPQTQDGPDFYKESSFRSVLSIKAETHNFPTTVEPFNGAATGSGGEIRDRLAGGKGSIPLAGTAVYMTPYPRLEKGKSWEQAVPKRKWLYQAPLDILIKASNGASDFGNKFGQPLINGSLLTFEHQEGDDILGYDKVIMQAGGIGYGKLDQALKDVPKAGDEIVILGGDNYRIGMGGAAVSSADTGAFDSGIELNAVQRSNPEMQKRVANAIRALVEEEENPIVSIHDHGAGGHLNCLSELVEDTGGRIDVSALPLGDPTLSNKEIIGNESQERMGVVLSKTAKEQLQKIAERERAPMYTVGKVTGDDRFVFENKDGKKPIDLDIQDLFGNSPKTHIQDTRIAASFAEIEYYSSEFENYLHQVLQLEAVACKDWLTNKVDRCVGGKVAVQQCVGPLQLPLANCGVMALDYKSTKGMATALGHAPIASLIDPVAGSRNAIAESLTNIIWAPLSKGLQSVSLSANWMWPCKNEGEDARLYQAVEAVSEFAIELGINIPTGKDSLSMKQKYSDREVKAPGTVIITAAGECSDITKVVEPVFQLQRGPIYYINMSGDDFALGGSSLAQSQNKIGTTTSTIKDNQKFIKTFETIQQLIGSKGIVAGHDIGSGGLIISLLEMCFSGLQLGAEINLTPLGENDTVKVAFAENCGIIFQAVDTSIEKVLNDNELSFYNIGEVVEGRALTLKNFDDTYTLDIPKLRDVWYKTSYLLDRHQSGVQKAKERYNNYKIQPLQYKFPQTYKKFIPELSQLTSKPKAAIIREKGCNSEREMAHAMYLAGFDVKDVHMTDLVTGRETLEDIQFIGAVGGFSNSDVLGSAKGWAGAFLYNEKAKEALDKFYQRDDTLSIGICNGCQLMVELDLLYPEHADKPKMLHNDSGKHECSFTLVKIQENNSVLLSSLAGSTLGVWISHGEGKFALPLPQDQYHIVATYGYEGYPANPNGSAYNTAMLASPDGRHLATMPHIERSIFAWNWAHYPKDKDDQVSPWLEAFLNARKWIEAKNKELKIVR